jgi:hypothetical protein
MNRSTTRTVILITGLITAIVHLIVLNLNELFPMFILNGLGYLVLLGLFFMNPGVVAQRRRLFHYAFIAFALATIIGFVLVGDPSNVLGWATKVDELILIIALWMNMSSEKQAAASAASGPAESAE